MIALYRAGPYLISKSLACYKQGSLRCHATRCCHDRGSSLRTAGMAGGCVGNIQTAIRRCPTPAWRTAERGHVWAGG